MNKFLNIKVLNLYAGIGGNRKLWENVEVTAVELNPDIAKIYQDFFPDDKVIVADAHQYLLDHHSEFDFIWSSPPCQTHSKMNKFTRHKLYRYPDMRLYQEILFLQHFTKAFWVVENVQAYYDYLIMPRLIARHAFWSNFFITEMKLPTMKNFSKASKKELMDYYGIYYEGNIYSTSHDPNVVLRNCVHPNLGLHVFNSMNNQELKLL